MSSTGYYARPTVGKNKAVHTQVHFVNKFFPVCGYKPHKTMSYQWCANGAHWHYLECEKCKDWLRKQYQRKLTAAGREREEGE